MAINLDKIFALNTNALILRGKRAELISSNIANADTPGYKAKGLDFQKLLTQSMQNQNMAMSQTNSKHLDVRMALNNNTEYRVPNQPDTGDGNTVDVQVERNLYLKNSLEYQASLQFVNGKIKGIRKAITGG
ncbi:MAG: flagellar basal body rod protein FlgB [Alteromonadaceae bacterium]|nr:flagellar basal body rod protein FlgB [Alteromonadaceae bacterium]